MTDGDPARDLVLAAANDDAKLQTLVASAARHGQLPWLMASIACDLTAPCAGLVARGMVLAGFLPQTEESDRLWATRLTSSPTTGWLADVHRMARARFEQQQHARVWYENFAQASGPEDAYAALRLFTATVDVRAYFSAELRPSSETLAGWPGYKRAHWHWNWSRVKAAVKKDEDQLKRTLLFGSVPGHAQHPKLL